MDVLLVAVICYRKGVGQLDDMLMTVLNSGTELLLDNDCEILFLL